MNKAAASRRDVSVSRYQNQSNGVGLLGPLNPPITDWQDRRVWLVGASTGIGRATAVALHALGARVTVSARNAEALAQFAEHHPGAQALPLDVTDGAALRRATAELLTQGPLDLVLYCAGHYQPMRADDFDLAEALRHQRINYEGVLHLLDAVLPALRAQGHGHLSLVGSVAGYRGLPRSLAYGPTKAALMNLAETLYIDLRPQGIGVSLVSPGFVATPLTARNDFTMPALITPDEAARQMLRGWAQGDFELHFPKRFTLAMKALRLLPFRWHQRLVRGITGL